MEVAGRLHLFIGQQEDHDWRACQFAQQYHRVLDEEALEQLKAEGYTRVALTTLDIIPGMEYNYKLGVFNSYKQNFKKMTIGTPLMYWQGQEEQADDVTEVLKAFATQFPKTKKGEGIIIMAHGTPNIANGYYAVIRIAD